jgi:pimeloyl-ACP methyl ester carboxylesterase
MTERILLHAGVADSRMYRGQVEALAPARALDLPGFGKTPLEGGSVDYRAFVRDSLPDEPATLIGTSLGAITSLELALESPDRVAALVLVGPGLDGHEWSDEVRAFGRAEDEALERGDLDAAVEVNVKMWLAGPRRSLDDVDPELRALVADMQRKAFELQEGHELRMARLDPPASTRLAEVRAPTLVVTGDEDVHDIHEIADKLVAGIPHAERETIADTAHLPSLERPDEFNGIVLAFLATHGV